MPANKELFGKARNEHHRTSKAIKSLKHNSNELHRATWYQAEKTLEQTRQAGVPAKLVSLRGAFARNMPGTCRSALARLIEIVDKVQCIVSANNACCAESATTGAESTQSPAPVEFKCAAIKRRRTKAMRNLGVAPAPGREDRTGAKHST